MNYLSRTFFERKRVRERGRERKKRNCGTTPWSEQQLGAHLAGKLKPSRIKYFKHINLVKTLSVKIVLWIRVENFILK